LESDRPGSRDDVSYETAKRERRIEQLIDRLPRSWRPSARWLRRPSRRFLRISIGVLLIVGSFLSILPVFGLWMLPIGLLLLAEDVPVLRRATDRMLEWVERRRPHWLQRNPNG
jgi:Flp pilus assembly protein TadB